MGEIIATTSTETAEAATSATAVERDGRGRDETQSGRCPATTTMPTKWVLAGHSMGTMAIELVRKRKHTRTHSLLHTCSRVCAVAHYLRCCFYLEEFVASAHRAR